MRKAFLCGVELHGLTPGPGRRFTFLIRQIFKRAGPPGMHATKFQGHVKESLLAISILLLIIDINAHEKVLEHQH